MPNLENFVELYATTNWSQAQLLACDLGVKADVCWDCARETNTILVLKRDAKQAQLRLDDAINKLRTSEYLQKFRML